MKKQILILALFVMAMFASVTNSYGQVCTPSGLNPAPGVPYDYEVTISGTAGATSEPFSWMVTQDENLLTATASAATYYTVNSGATASKINITWSSNALASADPFYLVVRYSETSSTGCLVKNMKVWQIKPANTFLLAVAGSDATGNIAEASTCPPDIDGALITAGSSPEILYNYGQTTIFYKVTASGVNGTWTPSIELPALGANDQNYNAAEWFDGTDWQTFGLSDGNVTGGTFTSTVTTAPATVAGSETMIRIKINNVKHESKLVQAIVLGVDGTLPGGTKDIVSTSVCTDELDFGKKGTHTIVPRPTVAPTTLPAFITQTL